MPISLYPGRRPSYDVQIKKLGLHFAGPIYVANQAHAHSGGQKTTATLSPRSFKSAGSDANPALPKAIKRARKDYPNASFVAGHLLNADFFGLGADAKNITILTSKANSLHKAFDDPIKYAGAQLQSAYRALHRAGVDVATVELGIQVSIEVTGSAWDTSYPENCIFDELTCKAKLVKATAISAFVNSLVENFDPGGDETEPTSRKRKRGESEDGELPSAKKNKREGKAAEGTGAETDTEVLNGAREFKAALSKIRQYISQANNTKVPNDPPSADESSSESESETD